MALTDLVLDFYEMTNASRVDMSDFELLKVLGTGAYGKVFLVRKITGADTGQLYAMKVLKKAAILQKAKTAEHIKTERQVLEAIRQIPFLVSLHYAFQSDAKLHLVMDYVSGGELFTHLNKRQRFSEQDAKIYIAELTLALGQLHKLGIIYRDIKLENILLDNEGHIVLADFGLSKEFRPDDSDKRTYSFCGTIEYMAPEVVKGGDAGHDFTVDWWSLGVLTFELLTGASPFTVDGDRNTQPDISKRIVKNHPLIPNHISKIAKDFILKLLTKNPKRRLGSKGLEDIKRHPFFGTDIDWDAILHKRTQAPVKPKLKNEMDTSNFAEEFTRLPITDSPGLAPPTESLFRGYSFISPTVIFGPENAVNEDMYNLLRLTNYQRPDPSQLHRLIKTSPFFRNYELIDREGFLGEGSFSICRRCRNRRTQEEFAVKIVSHRQKVDAQNEIELLHLCQGHANIVKLHEVYSDELHTYIIMELLTGGELFYRIRTQTSFSEKEASQLMKKLVSAVNFMHSHDLCHRDLKPENLLFASPNPDAEIKIIDFGFAKKRVKHQQMTTPCGTLLYTAPEVLRTATSFSESQSSCLSTSSASSSLSTSTTIAFVPSTAKNANAFTYGYDESCDLWSLGVILYTMLSGEVPFNSITAHRTAEDIVEDITRSQLSYDTLAWKNVSQAAKDLVKGLLTIDPSKRLTIKDLSRNAWIRGSSIPAVHENLMTPNILCQASRSLIVRAVNITMRAFQKAGQFQLSSVTDGLLARRRYAKKSTDSCSSTSSSTTAVVPSYNISSSTLPHTRRLCGNGVCRCRHALCPPTNSILSLSSFDFSEERLSQLIDQYPLTTTTITPPKRYGMTLRPRATAAATTNSIHHEFASPAPPPPLFLVPSLSLSCSSSLSSSSLSSITTDILHPTNTYGEKRQLASPVHHSLGSTSKKVKRSGTITIND
ncbi:unnamed protein product [Rotaria socialis]|uniref:non-specific serine/threonine protein kinase n=1 Tax=Rotaria socialis TaxID=392032 RepID=A0A818N494_9BILA|nr:unnamed protein product [Rotaria socialis]CAF3600043.1 unnamed protein product [Rotaria socialis]CAF4747880.1 unnamed protein product [Rotaria socialis]CAF4791363.1 unnamed protein product [Rotaria socialis]